MTQKEILESYVDEICDNLDSGRLYVSPADFDEVQGMLRICYVFHIISAIERDEYRARLFKSWYDRKGL